MFNLKYAYAFIERATGFCFQTLQINKDDIHLDNDEYYSIAVPISFVEGLAGKYYYNSKWHERMWSEVDEHGEPVEGATYTDVEWNPTV